MKSTRKILLAIGFCAILACLGGAFALQTNYALPVTKYNNKSVKSLVANYRSETAKLIKNARQSLVVRTRTHKQAVQACEIVKATNSYREWVEATGDTKPQDIVIRQKAIAEKRYAATQKPLATVQKLLEEELKHNPTQEQRLLLQNDLADVHFALGNTCEQVKHPFDPLCYRADYQRAVAHYQRAYEIDKSQHPLNAGRDLMNMGWASFNSSDDKNAVKCWCQAVHIFHLAGAKEKEAFASHSLSVVYQRTGHYANAVKASRSSLQLYRRIKKQDEVAAELHALGDIYLGLSYSGKALLNYNEAIILNHKSKHPKARMDEAGLWSSMSDLYTQIGKYDKALQSLNRVASLYRGFKYRSEKWIDNMTPEFGAVYMELGEYQEAQHYFDLALVRMRREKDPQWEARVLCDVGYNKLKQHRNRKALAVFKQALPTLEKKNMRRTAVYALTGMTTAFVNLNQPRQAIACGKQAINLLQSIRQDNRNLEEAAQRTFLAQHRGLYERVAALLIQQKHYDEAEQVLRFLRQEDVFNFAQPGSELAKKLAGLFEPLSFSKAEKNYFDSDGVKQVIVGQGCHASRVWQQALAQQEDAGHGRAALISTFNTDDTFYLLLTTAKERRAFSYSIKKGDFEALSKRLYYELSHPNVDPINDAQKMYKVVFAHGLEQALNQAGVTTALWFTSGTLRLIPIDALYDGQKYLVENPRINVGVTLNSPNLFAENTRGEALAVGVSQGHILRPDLPGEKPLDLVALPNVGKELRRIVSDATDGGTGPFPGTILLDPKCTVPNLERNLALHPSIVHFAMHFVSSSRSGQDPYFLMGDGTRLSLSQWKQTLKFQGVSLLTLSACSTGVGSLDDSIGDVSSIGEISQYLKAQSIVVSLWPVDDEVTTQFMPDFYAHLHRNPKVGKVQALRAAQRALINYYASTPVAQTLRGTLRGSRNSDVTAPSHYQPYFPSPKHPYAHPFYWAPFSLIGNWK